MFGSDSSSSSPFDSGSPFDSNSPFDSSSPFDAPSPFGSSQSAFGGASRASKSTSIFGGGVASPSPFGGPSPFDVGSSVEDSPFNMNSANVDAYTSPSLSSSLDIGSPENFDNLTNLNGRGENYGGNSIIDSLRGAQGRRLNNDTSSASLAEMYGDASLDTRYAGGAYNVTLSDIYSDRTKFEVAMGIQTGMIMRDKENDDLGYNEQMDLYGKNINKKNLSPFSKESIDMHNGKVLSPFSKNNEEGKSLFELYKKEESEDEEKKTLVESYKEKDKKAKEESNIFSILSKPKDANEMAEEESNKNHSKQINSFLAAGILGLDNGDEQMSSEKENEIVQEFRKKSQEEKLKMIKDNKLPAGLPIVEKQRVLSEQKKIEEQEKRVLKKKEIKDEKARLKAEKRKSENIEFENEVRKNLSNGEYGSNDEDGLVKEKDKVTGKIKAKSQDKRLQERKPTRRLEDILLTLSMTANRKIKIKEDEEINIQKKFNKKDEKRELVIQSQNTKKITIFEETKKKKKLKELASDIKNTTAPKYEYESFEEVDKNSKSVEKFRASELFDYEEETEEKKKMKSLAISKAEIMNKLFK